MGRSQPVVRSDRGGEGAKMVNHCRNSQFELNTLKISQETKRVVRRPYVWEKPGSRLYDYHYEIGGMYYQPMIKYIMHRGETGPRQVVDIPDRILSDYDKRAYALNNDDMGLEEFLTDAYRRRAKDVNAKYVHVENEKIRQSKRNTELNMVRGSACIRDKYLCQLQLYFTGKEAQLSLEGESAQTQIKRDRQLASFRGNKLEDKRGHFLPGQVENRQPPSTSQPSNKNGFGEERADEDCDDRIQQPVVLRSHNLYDL